MTDWADDKAMLFSINADLDLGSDDRRKIAHLLRQARIDALEEAARLAETEAMGTANEGYHFASLDIAAAIRSLKDKQP